MASWYHKYEYVFITALILILFIASYGAWNGDYKDTDNFTRAIRILDFIGSGTWKETLFIHSNYPFGEILHWTRPMDILWLLISSPLMLFMPLKDAVYYGGAVFSPVIGLVSSLVLVWGLRPYFGPVLRGLAVGLLLSQYSLLQIFFWGRPDHHSVMALLTVTEIALFLRYFAFKDDRTIAAAGFFAGISVWIAIEGLFLGYGFLAFLLIFWALKGKGILEARLFGASMFMAIFAGWLINPPLTGYFFLDNGRLSVLIVLLSGFTYLALISLSQVKFAKSLQRGGALILTAAVALGLLIWKVGIDALIAQPISPEIQEVWSWRVSELMSAFYNPVMASEYILVPLIAGGILLCFALRQKVSILWLLFMGIPLGVFFLLSCFSIRFAMYAGIFSIFPVILFARLKLLQSQVYENPKAKIPDSVMAVMLCVFIGPLFFATVLQWTELIIKRDFNFNKPEIVSDFKDLEPLLSNRKGAVLTDTFLGPEVMWKTNRPVIGTPYHRNVMGILDTHRMFFSEDMREVKKLLLKHRVTDIYLPANYKNDKRYMKKPEENTAKLYGKIMTGKDLPNWLTPVPEALTEDGGFFLYRVDRHKLRKSRY